MNNHYEYTQDYVRFFLHRSNVQTFEDAGELAGRTLDDDRIRQIVSDLRSWPREELKTHKDAGHPLHLLAFLAELGFNRDDPGIAAIVDSVMQHQSPEGPFQIQITIPKSFGGPGEPVLSWIMSDAPVLLYALIKLDNYNITPQIRKGVDYVADLVAENGWHCVASGDLGRFRGPGKKADPCPYATMYTLKMLGVTAEDEYPRAKEIGIKTLFSLWKNRRTSRPYMFAMGTDFAKLKLPFVWYDILNVVDTLSLYPQLYDDKTFKELLGVVHSNRTPNGYVPQSIYRKCNAWDFGQKKSVSEYMTAVVHRIEWRIANRSAR